MALQFCDGFADGLSFLGKWQERAPAGQAILTGVGRYGGNALQLLNLGTVESYLQRVITPHATVTVGFAFRTATLYNHNIAVFLSGTPGTIQTALRVTDQGGFIVRRGPNDIGSSATGVVPVNTWVYVEMKATLAGTATGSIQVRVNGTTVINLSNVQTRDSGTDTQYSRVRVGRSQVVNVNADERFGDIYITDGSGDAPQNGFLGEVAVEMLLPNGNGDYSQLTGSDDDSVDNYLLVDEPLPNLSDWVGSNTNGHKDTYSFTNLTGTGAVLGVQEALYAKKNDAGNRSIRAMSRLAALDTPGSDLALASDWGVVVQPWGRRPDDDHWTIADVNAAEFGAEIRP